MAYEFENEATQCKFEDEFSGEAVCESSLEGEGWIGEEEAGYESSLESALESQEGESELNPIRKIYPDAMMEHLGELAASAESEEEAAEHFLPLIGMAASKLLPVVARAVAPMAKKALPKIAQAVTRSTPQLTKAVGNIAKTLHRNPQTGACFGRCQRLRGGPSLALRSKPHMAGPSRPRQRFERSPSRPAVYCHIRISGSMPFAVTTLSSADSMADWHVARLVHIGAGGEDGDIYIRTLLGLRVVSECRNSRGWTCSRRSQVSQCPGPGRESGRSAVHMRCRGGSASVLPVLWAVAAITRIG